MRGISGKISIQPRMPFGQCLSLHVFGNTFSFSSRFSATTFSACSVQKAFSHPQRSLRFSLWLRAIKTCRGGAARKKQTSKPAAVATFLRPLRPTRGVHCDASQLDRFGTAGRNSPRGVEDFVAFCRQKAHRRLVRFVPSVGKSCRARAVRSLHAALKRFIFVKLDKVGNIFFEQSLEVKVVDGSPQPSLPRRRRGDDHFGGDIEAGVTPVCSERP